MDVPPLFLGTHNQKKRAELMELLAPHGVLVRSLAEVESAISVVEDGDSFAENASKKATQQARHLKQWVLGEDSGLCVDVLGGAPGIYFQIAQCIQNRRKLWDFVSVVALVVVLGLEIVCQIPGRYLESFPKLVALF